MGGQLSKSSSSESSNPSSTSPTFGMSSSDSSQTHESKEATHVSKSRESQALGKESSDPPTEEPATVSEIKEDGAAPEGEVLEEGEEEEGGECPFCLFMKEGGCRDEFVEWEKCVEEGERFNEDIAEKCFEITGALKKCMEAHRDYYAPLLRAEEEAMKELEGEKGKEREEATNRSEEKKGTDGSGASNGSDTDSQEKTVNGST